VNVIRHRWWAENPHLSQWVHRWKRRPISGVQVMSATRQRGSIVLNKYVADGSFRAGGLLTYWSD